MTQTGNQSQLFTMPSGAVLAVTVAPFQDAWALMKASLKTLKGMDLKSEDLKPADLLALKKGNLSLPLLMLALDRVVDFATSPEVEAAMWKCAARSLYIPAGSDPAYPGTKVSLQLFDDPACGNSAREDWAKILTSLLEVNCKPFLATALSSLFPAKTAEVDESQPSK